MTSGELRHGDPEPSRNDKYGFDKYGWPADASWPRGLEIHIYDDGRVKIGGWHTSAVVLDVSSYRTGSSNASGHVIVRFNPASEGDRAEEDAAADLEPRGQSSNDASEAEQGTDDNALDDDDDDAYGRATWEAITECRHLTPPYEPTAWIGMVQRWGAAEAARRLLVSGDIQDGFRRLIEARRHDLTVEWSALSPRWDRIFDARHRDAASWRLTQAGIEPPEHD